MRSNSNSSINGGFTLTPSRLRSWLSSPPLRSHHERFPRPMRSPTSGRRQARLAQSARCYTRCVCLQRPPKFPQHARADFCWMAGWRTSCKSPSLSIGQNPIIHLADVPHCLPSINHSTGFSFCERCWSKDDSQLSVISERRGVMGGTVYPSVSSVLRM